MWLSYAVSAPATFVEPLVRIAMLCWPSLTSVKDDLQHLGRSGRFAVLADTTLDLVDANAIAWRQFLQDIWLPWTLAGCRFICSRAQRAVSMVRDWNSRFAFVSLTRRLIHSW